MIQTGRIHNDWGKNILRSHHLKPGNDISLFFILEWEKENVISVIEDHLLENISSIAWDVDMLDTDFSYLSEHYNQFLQNIPEEDRAWMSCLLALSYENALSIATIWWAEAILVEGDDISQISSHDNKKHGFHYISHGDIPTWWTVYLSNTSLLSLLGESLVSEMTLLDLQEWENTVKSLIEEERYTDIHIFRITNGSIRNQRQIAPEWGKQSDILWGASTYMRALMRKISPIEKSRAFLDAIFATHKKIVQYIIFISGIILLFLLAYSLVDSLFNVVTTTSSDSKNELIKAQTLIEQSEKLTSNKQAFNSNIKSAEEILFKLRDDKLHMADTQELLSRYTNCWSQEVYLNHQIQSGRYITFMSIWTR